MTLVMSMLEKNLPLAYQNARLSSKVSQGATLNVITMIFFIEKSYIC
jgi:hypothetical protein